MAAKVLKRLVRVLLREGVSYQTFDELARRVYVQVAEAEFPIEGRKTTTSRISTLTGLHRKEVARLRTDALDDTSDLSAKRNRTSHVLSAWLRDDDFLDRKGDPLPLPFTGEVSFTELVRRYGRDTTPRAVLDELIRLDAVERDRDEYRLVARGFKPAPGSDELLELLGTDTAELLDTIDYNMTRQADEPFRLQFKVAYNNVPEEYADTFRKLSGRMTQHLIGELDRWLADHDRDHTPDILGHGRVRLGLSIFQIQEKGEDTDDQH